ncbi:MAG TPA: adenylate/guanylate cyclase domain-containing protein [Candidatus Bathyarchaeia archaeon]|nr:adenylate/guanylate cyclase domain-containing protein [Candidatus Bathyarchaeia archaeon]
MACPGCGHANPAGVRFCGGCGAPLEAVCARCQARNPPGNRFCHDCGGALSTARTGDRFASPQAYTPKHLAEKILTTGTALAGERKQVTVLFVDVAGFTSLSERLDPEEVHRLMSRAFDLMLAEVHRYEGTVNQFLGDGIMALFGAPIAHEDHARRAVHAALGIARALEGLQGELRPRGISFQVRQGLNTGLVVVGSIGSDLRMDYTAVGDTTNVAARLQQASAPGRITISEATHRLVRGYFDTAPLGQIHVKGKAEPVAGWEVRGAHETVTRLEVEAAHGLTPFVGRRQELDALLSAFAQAQAGQGRVAFVIGEAGIGKSRLLLELRRRIGDDADWREGHCLSFGKAMAFHPLVDLLRRQFEIEEGDGEAAIAAKIEGGVESAGADASQIAPYLRALLSIDPGSSEVAGMDPAQRRAETFEALRRLIGHAAQTRPQVFVIEDLHWVDSATEEFLKLLIDSVPALRALIVLTYRPGYASPFGERSYVSRVVPAALSAADSARMAAAVLAADDLPAEVQSLVAARAEGNPFYVEELIKSLEETGALRQREGSYEIAGSVAAAAVPGTIHDLIAARIDRLDEAPKRTLQLAAVIGREFTRRLVDRLAEVRERAGELLRELSALELIFERRIYPELAYMFKHALTQDVAYGSLLVQRRRELHGLVGRAIEELYADRLAEHYEVLGHHFSLAEDWERALHYLVKAAEKAVTAFSLRQALDLYAEALEAARRQGDRVPAAVVMGIHRVRADLFFGIGQFDQSRAEAEVLVELARRVRDRIAEADALVQIASVLQWMEDFPPALQRAQEAIEIAEPLGAQAPLAGALYVRGYIRGVSGRLAEAEADYESALASGRAAGDAARQALTLHLLALHRSWQGRYREGLELGDEGIRIAREHHLVIPLLRCLWNVGLVRHEVGEHDAALAALGEGLALAEKIGDDNYISRFLNTLGWLRIDCGDFARGIELSEQAYAVTDRSRVARHGSGAERRAFIRNNEADALIGLGDLAGAAEALKESFHTVQHPPASRWMTWRYSAHCYAGLGELALRRGDPERARSLADQSLEIGAPTSSRKYESWAWRLKGESATALGHWNEAETALRRAHALAESIRQLRNTWLADVALGRLDMARGRRDDALQHFRAARALIASLRASVQDPALRAGLESSPLVREVEDLAGPPE